MRSWSIISAIVPNNIFTLLLVQLSLLFINCAKNVKLFDFHQGNENTHGVQVTSSFNPLLQSEH